jgi:hypothetical protein
MWNKFFFPILKMNFRRTKTRFDPRVTYEEKEMHENKLIESPRYTEMTQRDAEMNAKNRRSCQ